MNTVWRKPLPYMTADDFLAWPGDGTGRTFQLVDGEVRPASPAARIHAAIQLKIGRMFVCCRIASMRCSTTHTRGPTSPAKP